MPRESDLARCAQYLTVADAVFPANRKYAG